MFEFYNNPFTLAHKILCMRSSQCHQFLHGIRARPSTATSWTSLPLAACCSILPRLVANGSILTPRASNREESELPWLPSEENRPEILAWISGPSLELEGVSVSAHSGSLALSSCEVNFRGRGDCKSSSAVFRSVRFNFRPFCTLA